MLSTMESSSSSSWRTILAVSFLFLSVLFSTQASVSSLETEDLLIELPTERSPWSSFDKLKKSPADFLPKFVGYATSNRNVLQWEGACFWRSEASLELTSKGGKLKLKLSNARPPCMDVYIFATPYQFKMDFYLKGGSKELEFEWVKSADYEYVKKHGVPIFMFPAGMANLAQLPSWFRVITKVQELYPLYQDSEAGEQAHIDFLKKNMGTTAFDLRPQASWVSNINPDDIHSGDFLALSKLRGSTVVFETLEKWVTGSGAVRAAVCLRDPEGKLWVVESGRVNDQGLDVIQVIPWEDWWEYERTKDPATPHIALLPLHHDKRAEFDETAAWKYALSVNNTPYGYHNVIFSWIDTVRDNYPPPLDQEMISAGMIIFHVLKPESEPDLWNEALNMRLGTKDLTLSEILVELQNRGSNLRELLAIPEQDDWIYSDGKSASCAAFPVSVYKHAGLFGSLADSIQATEFTVRDGYALKFYEGDPSRLPEWCNEGDDVKLQFCQILGKYRMDLPGYNTVEPYAKMNEKCPSLPPNYERPSDC